MTLPDHLVQRIESIAEREHRSAEALLEALLNQYERIGTDDDPIEDFIGAFDDDISDMSITVRETLHRHFGIADDRPA